MQQLFDSLFDLIFPPICLSCDRFGYFICPNCQKQMSKLDGFICPTCLMSCPDGQLHTKCKGNVDGLISCWNYEKTTQKVIKEIKYRFYHASIGQLVELFIKQRQQSISFDRFLTSKPLIIPVPLHPKRLKYRGFNQAEMIVRKLAKVWYLPLSTQILSREKFSKPQAELSKEERAKNTKDMFGVNPKLKNIGAKPLENQNIILIDDVWTTGSTAQACTKVLKDLGAEKVWVVTMAR